MAVNTVSPINIFLHLLKKSSVPRLILITSSLASFQESSDPSSIYHKVKADYHYGSYRANKVALNVILIEFHKREGDKIKMWGGDRDSLSTDLANAQIRRKLGTPHPSDEIEQSTRCVSGERGADIGKFVNNYAIGNW